MWLFVCLDGLKGDDAEKPVEEILSKLPTVKANAPKEEEKAGDMREAALSGGEAAIMNLRCRTRQSLRW